VSPRARSSSSSSSSSLLGDATRACRAGCAGLLTLVLVSVPTAAEAEPATDVAKAAEDAQREKDRRLRDQLELDTTPVPVGFGAIFLPAPGGGGVRDTRVVVLFEGETLAQGRLGERIVVPEGHYQLLIGSGPDSLRATAEVTVKKDATSVVKPSFAIVRVAVVDVQRRPLAQTFQLVSADGARRYGPVTPTVKAGFPTQETFLVAPGRYQIILGDSTDKNASAVAVQLAAGEEGAYRVVVDGDRILRSEFGSSEVAPEKSAWFVRWTLGATGSFADRKNQFSSYNGSSLMIGGFTKFDLTYDNGRNFASFGLASDQSFVDIKSPTQAGFRKAKLVDDVAAELVYNYRLGGIIGPYAHAQGRGTILPTYFTPSDPAVLRVRNHAGTVLEQQSIRPEDDGYRLFKAGYPLIGQVGAGLGHESELGIFRLGLRAGLAARNAYFGGGSYVESSSDGHVELVRLDDSKRFGGETTAKLGFTLGRSFAIDSRFDLFVGKNQLKDLRGESNQTYLPIFRWESSATARVSEYVSIVYSAVLKRDTAQLAPTQFAHFLRLQLQTSLL
jgi:hypothetical protein